MIRCLHRTLFAAGLLCLTSVVGCLGEPIPKRVVAGTTFTVPFPGGIFGVVSAQSVGGLLASDPQRGNIRFILCTGSSCTNQRNLAVRYMTRIFPDPGSPLGITGQTVIGSGPPADANILGEPIVILDVPGTIPAGTYNLASLFTSPGASTESLNILESIEVVAKPTGAADMFSDVSQLVGAGSEASATLRGYVPYPQVIFQLSGSTTERPAAGNFVVSYPKRVDIKAAFECGVLGQNSIVRYKLLPDPVPNPDMTKRVAVTFMDPDKRLNKISLAFTLSDPNSPVQTGSFQVVSGSQALYTLDGAPMFGLSFSVMALR